MRHLIFFHINLLEHWSLADKHVRIESDFVSNSGTLGRSHVIVGSTIKTALVDEGPLFVRTEPGILLRFKNC